MIGQLRRQLFANILDEPEYIGAIVNQILSSSPKEAFTNSESSAIVKEICY
jgi:hypothetical protein